MLVQIDKIFYRVFPRVVAATVTRDDKQITTKFNSIQTYHLIEVILKNIRYWAGYLALFSGILILSPVTVAAIPAEAKAPHLEEILAQARAQSRVLVIITLVIDDAKSSDPAAIDAAQRQLLAELAHFHVENVKTYRYLPMLAFSIEPVALGYLLGSPIVKIIQPDRPEVMQNSNHSISDHK